MPDVIKPEVGSSAMVHDTDLHKVLRLNKFFTLDCQVSKISPFVKVTVVGRKC